MCIFSCALPIKLHVALVILYSVHNIQTSIDYWSLNRLHFKLYCTGNIMLLSLRQYTSIKFTVTHDNIVKYTFDLKQNIT